MTLNPPRRARAVLYLIATFGAPIGFWAEAEGWLDKPTTVLVGSVLALIMGLATANTATPDTPPRNEVGRAKPLLALSLAMVLAIAGALLTVAAGPAQAYGWSGQRCKDFDASDTLCVNVHTIPYQNGMRVDQVQLCFDSHPSWPYIGATKTFNNTLTYYGSAGNWIGFTNVKDTNANACTLTNDVVQMGNGACYKMTGRIDFPAGPDSDWAGLNGKVLGGAYNC